MPVCIDNLNGIPKSVVRRLRRGKVSLESRLDLHGFTVSQAEEAVADFLKECAVEGYRMVLIITGKGSGALRYSLEDFLAPWENEITAVCTAHSSHGGNGAFYVMLRRRSTGATE